MASLQKAVSLVLQDRQLARTLTLKEREATKQRLAQEVVKRRADARLKSMLIRMERQKERALKAKQLYELAYQSHLDA